MRWTRKQKRDAWQLIWVASALIGLSFLIESLDIDRKVAALFYLPPPTWPPWPGHDFPWSFIYALAPVPGFLLFVAALIILSGGYFFQRLSPWRRQSLFLVLVLLLGPGLSVNLLLKDQLGRPRPKEIVEFGGQHVYKQFWQPGTTGKNSSFPSGHASIAYYLMTPWFVFRRKRKGLARTFLVGGLAFGSLVGFTRMIQGGHFLTDILWSGGIVYLMGGMLALFLIPPSPKAADNTLDR